jgi:hypothetical protein
MKHNPSLSLHPIKCQTDYAFQKSKLRILPDIFAIFGKEEEEWERAGDSGAGDNSGAGAELGELVTEFFSGVEFFSKSGLV